MLVEIYSDVVCPWCYIGKHRFEQALARYEDADEVRVAWRPFQLDPGAPAEATPVVEVYRRKFGGPDAALRIIDQVTRVATAEGLDVRLDEAMRSNTFDAHRLLWLAGGVGADVQRDLAERLFRAYFAEGRHLGDHDVLADLADDVGLDSERVRSFLASSDGCAETREALALAAERGITAVPTFVFEGVWTVPGAQEPETMLQVLRRVRERLVTPPPAT